MAESIDRRISRGTQHVKALYESWPLMDLMWMLLAGACLAGAVSLAAFRKRALSADGALAATAVGATTFAAGDIRWSILLLLFFVTSSALSRLPPGGDPGVVERGGRRSAVQVLANGGMPALAAALFLAAPSPWWPLAFAGSLASATADTWSSEVGSRYGGTPRDLLTRQPATPGTSGAVSRTGSLAALAGSALIAVASPLLGIGWPGVLAVAAAGLLGSLSDSLLGATIQEARICPSCGRHTEQRVHQACGTPTARERGVPGFNNDAVNLVASVLAAILASAMAHLL